jgi:RNA polymerase sigma factor (sigma-70 family)
MDRTAVPHKLDLGSDRQLIADYATTRSDAHFAALAEKFTPLVYGACYRVLQDSHSAEDAVQATFLVLARRAAGIDWNRTSISGWLYGAAVNCAKELRRRSMRSTQRDVEAAKMRNTSTREQLTAAELSEVGSQLDGALATLPQLQREALVLRYLRGQSEAETARELNCTSTAVNNRVRHGLANLRQKLSRSGLMLSATAIPGILTAESFAIPPGLVQSVGAIHAGNAVASATASATAKAVINTSGIPVMFSAAALGIAAIVMSVVYSLSGKAPATTPAIVPAVTVKAVLMPNQWTPLNEPPAGVQRFGWEDLRYVSEMDGVVVFAGFKSPTAGKQNAIWLYRYQQNQWQLLHVNSAYNRDETASDAGHTSGRMVYDRARNVIVYSGLISDVRNDRFRTWIFDPHALTGWEASPRGIAPQFSYDAISVYVPHPNAY